MRGAGLYPLEFSVSSGQAAILQQTAEYIFSLEQEKTRLLQQNAQLKRFIQVGTREALTGGGVLFPMASALPPFNLGLPGRSSVDPPQSGGEQRTRMKALGRQTSGRTRRPRTCAGR